MIESGILILILPLLLLFILLSLFQSNLALQRYSLIFGCRSIFARRTTLSLYSSGSSSSHRDRCAVCNRPQVVSAQLQIIKVTIILKTREHPRRPLPSPGKSVRRARRSARSSRATEPPPGAAGGSPWRDPIRAASSYSIRPPRAIPSGQLFRGPRAFALPNSDRSPAATMSTVPRTVTTRFGPSYPRRQLRQPRRRRRRTSTEPAPPRRLGESTWTAAGGPTCRPVSKDSESPPKPSPKTPPGPRAQAARAVTGRGGSWAGAGRGGSPGCGWSGRRPRKRP